jgi:hypothetical protein
MRGGESAVNQLQDAENNASYPARANNQIMYKNKNSPQNLIKNLFSVLPLSWFTSADNQAQ